MRTSTWWRTLLAHMKVTVRPRVPNKPLDPLLHVQSRTLRTLHRFVRSSKRPRTTSTVEHVNRFGSPTREGVSSIIHPSRPAPPDPSGPPPSSVRHTSLEVESDDPEPDRERAPSPATTILGHTSSTRPNAADSTNSVPNPLDPAIADHRNRPWPPADDRTLIRFKMTPNPALAVAEKHQLPAAQPRDSG